jgi:hypothetical protein
MRSAARFIAGAAAAVVALGLAAAPSAGAAAGDVVVHDLAVTAADQQAVRDYWTTDRIANMAVGPSSPGQTPVDGPTGAGFAPGTAVDKTIGRLFFVDRGEDSSCTATLLASANRSTIVTAGHCVHGMDLIGNDPQWTSKLLFVPGFRDNTRPFGDYVPRQVVVDSHWVADDQQSAYDEAFLVLNPGTDGRPAGVGQAIGLGLPGGLPAQEFGYPRAAKEPGHQGRPEFTGQRVAHCWGTPKENPGSADITIPKGQWGVPCDMGGGSSGGPRLTLFNDKTGLGTVVGVDTEGWSLDAKGKLCEGDTTGCTRYLFGPQFTAAVTGPLFLRAQAL